MRTLSSLLAIISTSLFTGACLVVALVLVPYWRAMGGLVFLDYFGVWAPRIGLTMLPLEALSQITLLVACIGNRRNKQAFAYWLVATILMALTFVLFFVYFAETNSSFVNKSVVVTDVALMLDNWNIMHWIRTGIAGMAVISSGLALMKSK